MIIKLQVRIHVENLYGYNDPSWNSRVQILNIFVSFIKNFWLEICISPNLELISAPILNFSSSRSNIKITNLNIFLIDKIEISYICKEYH